MVLGSQAYLLSFLINISEKVLSPQGEVHSLTAWGALACCDNLDVTSTDMCHHPMETGFQWSKMTPVVSLHSKLPGTIHFQPASPVSKGQERLICMTALRLGRAHDKMWEKRKKESEVPQSCLTLCDPVDCSLPGSSIHGIFQARILEWVAISFSRGNVKTRCEAVLQILESTSTRYFCSISYALCYNQLSSLSSSPLLPFFSTLRIFLLVDMT